MTESRASSELYSLLAEYQQALQHTDLLLQPQGDGHVDSGDVQLCDAANDYRRFFLRNGQVLASAPLQFRHQAANWFGNTAVGRDAETLIHRRCPPASHWLLQQFVPVDDPLANLLWQYNCHAWVHSVDASPTDGRVAIAVGDVVLLLSPDGELLRTIHVYKRNVNDSICRPRVSFSPCGKHIALASTYDTLRVWSATDGQLLRTLHGHEAGVVSVSFSPCGKRVATASDDHTVRVWSATDGELLKTLHGHEAGVISVCFSSCGKRIASGSWDQTVRV